MKKKKENHLTVQWEGLVNTISHLYWAENNGTTEIDKADLNPYYPGNTNIFYLVKIIRVQNSLCVCVFCVYVFIVMCLYVFFLNIFIGV